MSHTIYGAKFNQTIIHQRVLLRRDSQSHIILTTGKSVVTIILCLHVLIARHILLILDMLIIFSKHRCLKRYQPYKYFYFVILSPGLNVYRACVNDILSSG